MFKNILVGTDGSGTAGFAVKRAVELAKVTGAQVTVVSAYPPPQASAPPFTEGGTPGIEIANGLLADVEKRYGADVSLRKVAREGNAAEVMLDIAEEDGIDVIVVGNRGMSGAKRFVMGSVPNAISHHAACHVLIVHTSDE